MSLTKLGKSEKCRELFADKRGSRELSDLGIGYGSKSVKVENHFEFARAKLLRTFVDRARSDIDGWSCTRNRTRHDFVARNCLQKSITICYQRTVDCIGDTATYLSWHAVRRIWN
jgi:hypothetical protein